MSTSVLRNLTPHPVDIILGDGVFTILPEPVAARIALQRESSDPIVTGRGTIETFRIRDGETLDLPEKHAGTVLIVSRMVATANPHRDDLVFPLDLVRDEIGRVIGCGSLGRVHTD